MKSKKHLVSLTQSGSSKPHHERHEITLGLVRRGKN